MEPTISPFKQVFAVRRQEWPLTLSLSVYFFLVITTFWILKPIKKELFVGFYRDHELQVFGTQLSGASAEQLAKLLNMFVAVLAVAAFSRLANHFRRERLTYVWCAFMAMLLLLFSVWLRQPGPAAVWAFYLYGDFFNTVMVASFFAFANDVLTPAMAKRSYGVIGLGGVLGGAVGSIFLATTLERIPVGGWLLIGVGAMGAVALAGLCAGRAATILRAPRLDGNVVVTRHVAGGLGMAARLVMRSRYLLAVIALVTVYEFVSTILDYQFTATLEHLSKTQGLDFGSALRRLYAFTNSAAVVVQLFATSFVMMRFGVGVALLVLPISTLAGSLGFLVVPGLWTASALSAGDNAFNFSINQSARETLYTVVSSEEKYKAKAMIDMLGQRVAKSLGIGLNLLIAAGFTAYPGVRILSLVTLPLLAAWTLVVLYLGREFERRARA